MFNVLSTGPTGNLEKMSSGLENNSATKIGSGFLDMLSNHLEFGLSTIDITSKNDFKPGDMRSNSQAGFNTSFKPDAPWEKPVIAQKRASESSYSKSNKPENSHVKPNKETKKTDVAENRKPTSEKNHEAENSQKTDKNNDLVNAITANPEIASFFELNSEDLQKLTETLSELDDSTLEFISENSEEIAQQLELMIQQLENIELNEETVRLIESGEFKQFLSELSALVREANQTDDNVETLTESELTENNIQAKNPTSAKKGRANTEVTAINKQPDAKTSKENEEAVKEPQNPANAPEDSDLQDAKTSTRDGSQKTEKNHKHVKEATETKTIIDAKENSIPVESLRQTHSKNQTTEQSVDFSGLEGKISDENSSNPNENPRPTVNLENQQSQNSHQLVQEISKQLFKAVFGKSETNSIKNQSFTYGPVANEGSKSNTSANNNSAQNGTGNGFSSSNSAPLYSGNIGKQTTQASNSVFLSQLIEKAEMLKTSDGKKILNMELDPKELGKMEMELTSKDGTLTAKISAENELARIRLEELAQQIKEQLNSQGINLSEITVDISSRQPDERSNQQLSGGKYKSGRTGSTNANSDEKIIRENILPNLRKMALNIQSVDLTV